MPSGSYVVVRTYSGYGYRPGICLNVYVYPLSIDAYKTTGLCGNYNLNATDDGPASGTFCTTDCEVHR